MADDFEKAILITFNSGGVEPSLKERAAAYIAGIKQAPDCWRLCVERFGGSLYPEVKFWCLATLHEIIAACYTRLDPGSRQMIKGALLTWLQRDCTVEQPALPAFLRNKLAQAIVAVVKAEYPAVWPDFFRELVAAAGSGPGLADMFARIMTSVDEDIISLDIPRSADETKLSMAVKDAMREQCIAQVAGAWFSLTQLYTRDRPELAAFVLASCARYVHWMDIGLVANDRFIPLLGELMDSPHAGLRCAATDVLIEVVSKRMEPTAKIALVQQLKVAEACERLSANLVAAAGASKAAARGGGGGGGDGGSGPAQQAAAAGAGQAQEQAQPPQQQQQQQLEQDEEVLAKFAKLLATLAGEVMDALKRVENVVISFNVTGLGVDDEAGREVTLAAQAANRLLDALTRAALGAFSSGLETISLPLVPFIGAYVARLRALNKRGQQLPAGAQLHLQAVLEGVAVAARYPDDGPNEDESFPAPPAPNAAAGCADAAAAIAAASGLASAPRGGGFGSEPAAQAAREEQWEVEERRRELLVLLKNAAKLAFPEALAFVAAKLQAVLQQAAAAPAGDGSGSGAAAGGPNGAAARRRSAGGSADGSGGSGGGGGGGAKFQDTELAVMLVYELGEGAPEDALKPGGGLAQLFGLLLQRADALPAAQHRLVALALLETSVRYCKLLASQPAALPGVLGLFLGPRGLGHPSPAVATRAAYLFARLTKTLRGQLRPFLDEICARLQPLLVIVATVPPPGGGGAYASREPGAAAGRGGGAAAAAAPLVDDRLYVYEAAGLLLGQEELPAAQQLAALQQLLQPLTRQIEANLGPAAAEAGGGSASWAILQALEAVARLNKGFKHELCTRSRPQLGAAFLACLEASLAVPAALPGHKQLRARFISFLHRLVEGLLGAVLPYLPAALEALMGRDADVTDMTDVLTLLVQLINRFKEGLAKLVEAALPIAAARVHALLGPDWDWSGRLASPAAMSAQAAQQQVAATLEDAREKGELQRSYYLLLHAVASNGLVGSLLAAPPQVLDSVLTGLAKGAATHVDPSVRRTCIQVFVRLLAEWCPAGGSERVPGFRSFALQQLGGQACVLGLLGAAAAGGGGAPAANGAGGAWGGGPSQQGPLDARDAATVALLGDAAAALKALHERCGDECAGFLATAVLPASGLPGELQQQLLAHVRESEAKALKDFLRELLLSVRAAWQQGGK